MKTYSVLLLSILIVFGTLAGCAPFGWSDEKSSASAPFYLPIGAALIGELPPKNNVVEQAIEAYTHTELQFEWIPMSAYDDKLRLMIAAGELPKLIKLGYAPVYIATIKDGQFWELGPLLKDYPHLSALDNQYYKNISVEGRIYGVPIIRDFGRATIQYRKDWFDRLGLEVPITLEDWYRVVRALTLEDPDGNGKQDTYGMVLEKKYNQDVSSILTRISVSQGGPNKWLVENGHFTPEFMTKPFFDTMKLFRRLYKENLINSDFVVVDTNETTKIYDSGRAGIQISGGNVQTWLDKLTKTVPDAIVDVALLTGPGGIRLPGEAGNAGFLAIPKDSVKTLEEVEKILDFLNKLFEPPMQTVITKGVEGRHWADRGDYTEVLNRTLDLKEVKPYRDLLPFLADDQSSIKPSLQPELYLKNQKIGQVNRAYIVENPALTLESDTYREKGKELETIILDAETKFIMGMIDEEGWNAELAKWKQAGGDQMSLEYERSL
ncbi:extracellular solute-binding protein [Paenibacillus donghaensis]|uniref:ABC transporter substrate-binding protein n=1 Tax=Paenibacillus donghaensis TaxID=414771 RepID=A0A2Z2KT01_9BACL|nr:extracellular solute-binding protein [Paenibacillus donghaensis]ASA22408.1 ABC transporter substrate-binding protein [Paenibacillus donghaensis]